MTQITGSPCGDDVLQPCPSPDTAHGLYYRPYFLLVTTTLTIFVAEFLVMMTLQLMPMLTGFGRAVTDAVILSLTVFPSLYILVFKPMRLHIMQRQQAEAEKDELIRDLQKALEEVKTLRGIIPICAWCKNIRDDNGYWQKVEDYMEAHTEAEFSHGICPKCSDQVVATL